MVLYAVWRLVLSNNLIAYPVFQRVHLRFKARGGADYWVERVVLALVELVHRD